MEIHIGGLHMSTEKLNTEIRKEQITQVAFRIIASEGIKGLSVAQVARQVGLVPSALYRHFASKDELLDSVLDSIGERLLANVGIVSEKTVDPLERLGLLLRLHVSFIRENQGALRVVFAEDIYGDNPQRRTRVYQMIERYLVGVGEIVRQGQREGRIRPDVEPETISTMFLGLIQPAAILWHMSNGKFDVTKHAEKAWRIFSDAIRVSEPVIAHDNSEKGERK